MTPVLVMAVVAFGVVVGVRRGEVFSVRWSPSRDTWAAVLTAGLVVPLVSASLLLFPEGSTARDAVHWIGIYALCGCAVPWGYVTLVERSSARAMGLDWQRWKLPLASNLGLGLFLLLGLAFRVDLSEVGLETLARGSYTLLVGGLFELYLYYGFLHLRLEKAFGPVPAIVGSASLYTLWHIGTELPLHPSPLRGLLFLFVVGLFYQSVFSLTRSLLSIWPFFFLGGVLTDFVNLGFPERVTHRLGWATLGWILMLGIPLALPRFARRGSS